MRGNQDLRLLKWGVDLAASTLPGDELEFLRTLGGPTLIAIPGKDPIRTRVVTTLLHGNEPSGLRAMHRWLRSESRPATQVLFFIASVETALADPPFSHRQLPGRRDFNRCFAGPPLDADGELARVVVDAIRAAEPECLVDLHNNTGHNPAYGVSVRLGESELGLVSLFADRVVHAPLALGTLVEATVDLFPSVTIECGRAGDPRADDVAHAGLSAFLGREDLELRRRDRAIRIFDEPVRVCVARDIDLAFADAESPAATLTISADIDRHNFEYLPAGSPIGWLDPAIDWPLDARRTTGEECSRELFRLRGRVLETAVDFIPIMMTTSPEIAKSDCLFYAARETGPLVTGEGPRRAGAA